MNIIYSIGKRIGGSNQALEFIKNTNHKVKIAAYSVSSYSIPHVDWILDPMHKVENFYIDDIDHLRYNLNHINSLVKDVIDFNPDLIITDCEHILSFIARKLNIKLWYCSSLHLIDGWIAREKIIYNYWFELFKNQRTKFPEAERTLIYSPFGDLSNSLRLKKKYEWIRPYYSEYKEISIEENIRKSKLEKIIKHSEKNTNYIFTDGLTNDISNAIYNNQNIISSPSNPIYNKNNISSVYSLTHLESMVNSVVVEKLQIGCNIGQIELIDIYDAVDLLNAAYNKKYNDIEFNDSSILQLHEEVDKYANSF